MKVLVTTPGLLGHIQPMAPLARALAERGHDVTWAVIGGGAPEVERLGFRAIAIAPSLPLGPKLARERFPEVATLPLAEQPRLMFGKLWGAIVAPEMLAGLVPLVAEWPPDLVVCDAGELAGHIVAAEGGIPSVTKGFGPLLPAPNVAVAGDEVAHLWLSRGLEPRPYGGAYDTLYLDPFPPLLAGEAPAHVPVRAYIRPERDDAGMGEGGPVPVPMPGEPAGSPFVYLTMGTVFSDASVLRAALDALAALPVRVLVTVGPKGDPAVLGPPPPNVRVERYVPQSAVFGTCDVVVSHSGSGTVLGALAAGIPQLCLPRGADQFFNAAVVARSGAGLALQPEEATSEAILGSVRRLLAEGSFRERAEIVSESIASMPSADEVAASLETLR